ncbi:hypothetical protein [Bradyrhizobium sp. STM 3809]|uniref:hypothetical protein n=1 Tax=Bradyrhizobium sp. STM 3809 TaxID=551936 RepID=UPI000240A3B2|nr:hypothetical protein [Bradyrhizobium sp. STM 3809]CCE03938.1 conserved hypothetical protein [Bradyrhizobium sp. STM 3809]
MTTNRRVLVDNATLSGVERLIGESQILNLNNRENDILCFEKLITAILFSDAIVSIDDYKDKFRSERLKKFDFIDFRVLEKETYAALSRDAAEFAKGMVFSFDGSKPAGDVVSFFESLRIDPQLRWDVFVSSEYLTLSLLVADTKDTRYEAAIDSVFRAESTDHGAALAGETFSPSVYVEGRPEVADVKSLVKAFSSGNANFAGTASGSLLNRAIFGYGWTAERAHFYNAAASIENADAFLAPMRDAFCESCCRLESRSQVNGLLDGLKSRTQETLVKIVDASGRGKFAMKLPFFTAYFISSADNPRQCIDMALHARTKAEFRECREILHNLAHLSSADRYKEVNTILRFLEQSCTLLMNKYGVVTDGGPQVSISLGLTGPSISFGTKLNQLFRHYRHRPFVRVFRNIAQDMLNVERLGGLYDKLCSSMREHKEAMHPKIAVTPKFMERKENEYGRPAEP